MDKPTADRIISEYIKKLYGFAVSKTYSIEEAEELSAQIVLEVYKTLLKRDNIANIDGYIYRVASGVYARFVSDKTQFTATDGIEYIPDSHDMTEQLISKKTAAHKYTRQVKHYFDEQHMKREREKSQQRTPSQYHKKNTLE